MNLQKVGKIILLIAAFIAVLTVSIYVSIKFATNQGKNNGNNLITKCDPNKVINHAVQIQNNKVIPETTVGSLCDTITITNNDDQTRSMAFGEHINHEFYNGIEEKLLSKDESFTFTLDKAGSYTFHDHDQEEVKGWFQVNENKP